jgi:predicted MPP superfamily phosphohydrolase
VLNEQREDNDRMTIWLVLAAVLIVFFIWQDNDIVITRLDFDGRKVPQAFEGYRVLHVSDLHSKRFGQDQKRLIRAVKACQPDIIVITGDVIDGRRKKTEPSLSFVSQAVGIAPVYYVSGNHEWRYGQYGALYRQIQTTGAVMMDNAKVTLKRGDSCIELMGVKDLAFGKQSVFKRNLNRLAKETSGMTILLSHHPEKIEMYAAYGFDLVFSGHAHGGQARLPFIGGLYAPGQGAFPKYTSGLHKVGETSMVVSRGLGNSLFPLRAFNRPELVLVTLHTA